MRDPQKIRLDRRRIPSLEVRSPTCQPKLRRKCCTAKRGTRAAAVNRGIQVGTLHPPQLALDILTVAREAELRVLIVEVNPNATDAFVVPLERLHLCILYVLPAAKETTIMVEPCKVALALHRSSLTQGLVERYRRVHHPNSNPFLAASLDAELPHQRLESKPELEVEETRCKLWGILLFQERCSRHLHGRRLPLVPGVVHGSRTIELPVVLRLSVLMRAHIGPFCCLPRSNIVGVHLIFYYVITRSC
mmetsp:Transcript_1365/g.4176  ORF Transcript_1365/g.4176 Transcript_1365/m.4176 type:complete len:248 (+) Transcript_1365:1058-1801(+)